MEYLLLCSHKKVFASRIPEKANGQYLTANNLFAIIRSVDGFYLIVEVAVVENIDIETFAAGFYAQHDMARVACDKSNGRWICLGNNWVDIGTEESADHWQNPL